MSDASARKCVDSTPGRGTTRRCQFSVADSALVHEGHPASAEADAVGLAFRISTCVLAAAVGAAIPTPSAAAEGRSRSIDVVVHDSAGVPAEVLERARAVTASVLAKAGIRIAWMDERRAECLKRLGPDAPERRAFLTSIFAIRIVVGSTAEGHRATPDTLGQAAPGARLATVFQRLVEQRARDGGVDVALVLGHVIAHELGHLLLRRASHSAAGVMQRTLDLPVAAQGRLVFTDDEARRMTNNALGQALCE
jgi:hypothetical protein